MTDRIKCTRCGADAVGLDGPQLCNKCYASYHEELDLVRNFYNVPPLMTQGLDMVLRGLKQVYPNLDLTSGHFAQTPSRVARMFIELCSGLAQDPAVHLQTSFEEGQYGGIILIKDIQFTSLCAHHFAIFRGVAHVGYIPSEKRIIGLSKINRVVEILAARPQVQEQLTFQIADTINKHLKPKGIAVVVEAEHDCIAVRGVKSKGSVTKTSEMRGIFLENYRNCKDEFMALITQEK